MSATVGITYRFIGMATSFAITSDEIVVYYRTAINGDVIICKCDNAASPTIPTIEENIGECLGYLEPAVDYVEIEEYRNTFSEKWAVVRLSAIGYGRNQSLPVGQKQGDYG